MKHVLESLLGKFTVAAIVIRFQPYVCGWDFYILFFFKHLDIRLKTLSAIQFSLSHKLLPINYLANKKLKAKTSDHGGSGPARPPSISGVPGTMVPHHVRTGQRGCH